jgi:pilus assembly protein CpaB
MDRQKLVMIFGAALVCATLLTWFLYAKTQAPQKEKMVRLVAAARDLPAGTRLKKPDLKRVSVVERDVPRGALLDEKMALERALLFPMNVNEPVITSKLTTTTGADGLPATIEPGKRAVSVSFTDSTGVAGLIQPRSRVDVLFTRSGSFAEAITTTVLEDLQVLAIGRATEAQTLDTKSGTTTTQRSPTQVATLLVTPEEARKLELAKNNGKLSLALRNPLDRSRTPENEENITTAEVLDPAMYTRAARARLKGKIPASGSASLRDKQAWARLIGEEPEPPKPKPVEKKEPPKPRAVVDVYRGDKHVQEIFQDE